MLGVWQNKYTSLVWAVYEYVIGQFLDSLKLPTPKQGVYSMDKDQDFYKNLGWALRSQRRVRKVSIEQVSEAVGVSNQQIQKYETGQNRIPVDKLIAYCDVLQIKHEWIVNWADKVDMFCSSKDTKN